MVLNSISVQRLQDTYDELPRLMDFLDTVRNDDGKIVNQNNVRLRTINKLFGEQAWEEKKTGNGHRKIENFVTEVMIEYSAHDDPVDAGGVVYIAEAIQDHINRFYYGLFGCGPRNKDLKEPNFQSIANALNSYQQDWRLLIKSKDPLLLYSTVINPKKS